MTTPSGPDNGDPSPPEGVSLGKSGPASDPTADVPFDPYRFGKPDHPIPAEYAPPGYTGPTTAPASPYDAGSANPYAPPPGTSAANPFANPPGTPYAGGPPQPPYQYPPDQYPPGQYPPNQYPPGQYPPGPYGYGGPQPPPYHGYAQPKNSNGKATATLVLGILSIVLCWLAFFDAVFVILALIFGLIALSETKTGRSGGRSLAIAGLACMVVGAILATLISIKYVHVIRDCGGLSHRNDSAFNQCVQDHI
jgi:hypothetical protein